MVRRLKEDVRQTIGGFPKREVKQIDLNNLPSDTPELRLSKLLDEYRQVRQVRMSGATRRKQATAALLISNLQQRLLSSVEAFARTLAVHRRTMERIWAGETATMDEPTPKGALFDESDSEDERSQLTEEEQQSIIEYEIENATRVAAGDISRADVSGEKELLGQMQEVAEAGRGLADERVLHLLKWIRENMCPSVHIPGEGRSSGDGKWTDLRVLIFTEYEDTRRYLVALLRNAIADTDLAKHRIAVYHGPTPPDKREAIKRGVQEQPSFRVSRRIVRVGTLCSCSSGLRNATSRYATLATASQRTRWRRLARFRRRTYSSLAASTARALSRVGGVGSVRSSRPACFDVGRNWREAEHLH